MWARALAGRNRGCQWCLRKPMRMAMSVRTRVMDGSREKDVGRNNGNSEEEGRRKEEITKVSWSGTSEKGRDERREREEERKDESEESSEEVRYKKNISTMV